MRDFETTTAATATCYISVPFLPANLHFMSLFYGERKHAMVNFPSLTGYEFILMFWLVQPHWTNPTIWNNQIVGVAVVVA